MMTSSTPWHCRLSCRLKSFWRVFPEIWAPSTLLGFVNMMGVGLEGMSHLGHPLEEVAVDWMNRRRFICTKLRISANICGFNWLKICRFPRIFSDICRYLRIPANVSRYLKNIISSNFRNYQLAIIFSNIPDNGKNTDFLVILKILI